MCVAYNQREENIQHLFAFYADYQSTALTGTLMFVIFFLLSLTAVTVTAIKISLEFQFRQRAGRRSAAN
jgi:hypothetical protein